ncbi:hypothetical protein FSP39_019549 [Pinctada imbricata]|uniref:Uncharacterized protein n=1 Tax=Pinctada imbricata TaxID=66713 RepID=A0AA89BXP0_PINIB|nr:hypothetical protein FSP39_019549 [Pinctada imbricata]
MMEQSGLLIWSLFLTFLCLGVVSSDSDCPDFTHKPPPVPLNVTCTTEADCGSEEECCPYRGHNYCIPEKDYDHHKKNDDDDDECHDDDDDYKKGHHKEKREKKCHKHVGKIVCIIAIAVGGLLVCTIGVLCCIKKCCAKKRKVTSSTLELRVEKYPSNRGREYALQMFQESEQSPISSEKKALKEKEALDAWALRTQSQDTVPVPAPPSYGPVAPPAYTSAPPPSYHM